MNQKLAFLLGLLLGASFAKFMRRRPSGGEATADPRAEGLRRKLADTRAETGPSNEPDRGEPSGETRATAPGSDGVEALRRRVYEEGRSTAEEMRRQADES